MPNINNIKITPEMLNKIAELDMFKANWDSGAIKVRPEVLRAMKMVATIESVGSSNRIEGNKMSDAEIENLFKNIKQTSFKSRDEEEVAGYADLIERIFNDYSVIPLNENYIKQLHKILMGHSTKDIEHRGEYKKTSNRVAAFDVNGNEIGSIFETATPFDTPRLIGELLDWTNLHLKEKYLHPIVVIGVFIVHFLSIHPFKDGNGRMSRALTTMLMLQNGYSYVPYSSMESIIEASKGMYYRSLHETQKTIWTDVVDYVPWLDFFITSLQKQKRHLESKLERVSGGDTSLSRNALNILSAFEARPEWSSGELSGYLNIKLSTVKNILRNLTESGRLVKHGNGRTTFYTTK
ncbi:MAG: Fic family protein [Alphaproteobacteria bacterium]|nr:Fic family protein [Alphaproteobacteria bacterium]